MFYIVVKWRKHEAISGQEKSCKTQDKMFWWTTFHFLHVSGFDKTQFPENRQFYNNDYE